MKRARDEFRAPAIVANNAIRDSRHPAIDHAVKVVLWAIASRLNAQGVAWPTMQLLAGDASMHRVTVIEIVQWLREVGVVVVDDRAATKSFTMRIDADRLSSLPPDVRRTKGKRLAKPDGLSGATSESPPTTNDRLSGATSKVAPDYRQVTAHRLPPTTSQVAPDCGAGSPGLHRQVVPGYPKDQDEDPNEGSSEGPIHALTREGVVSSKASESTPMDPEPLPQSAFTLTPPEPVAAKTAPKRSKPAAPTTAPTSPDVASSPPVKAETQPKAPKARKAPEERADAKYRQAFDAGMAKGAGLTAFATLPNGLVRQTLVAIATTHATRDGELLTGEDLLAWFEQRAEAFRKHAKDLPDLKFNGGWTPKGFLWWLNNGCKGEPRKRDDLPQLTGPIPAEYLERIRNAKLPGSEYRARVKALEEQEAREHGESTEA